MVSPCSFDNSVMVCFGNKCYSSVDWWSLVYSVFMYCVKVRHCGLKWSLKIRPKSFKTVPKYLLVSVVSFLLLITKMRWLVSRVPCEFSVSTGLCQCGGSGDASIAETRLRAQSSVGRPLRECAVVPAHGHGRGPSPWCSRRVCCKEDF